MSETTVRSRETHPSRNPVAFGLDLAVVLVFVAIGRSAHDEANAFVGLIGTAAPFAIALVVAWGFVMGLRLRGVSFRAGAVVWAITWVIGLTVRSIVFSGGVAVPFIVVAGVSLAVGLLGWRLIYSLVERRTR